jgi:hypothetical protein
MLGRFLIIVLIIFLAILIPSCNKTPKTGLNWFQRPYSDIVPEPRGKWMKEPTYSIDLSQVYGYPDLSATEHTLPAVTAVAPVIISDFMSYSSSLGITPSPASSGDITIHFYYGKYVTSSMKTASDVDLNNLFVPGNLCVRVITNDKATSALVSPPEKELNYNGVVYLRLNSRVIQSADLWLNVYAYDHFKDTEKKLADRGIPFDALAAFRDYCRLVMWHELGHAAWGLSDDPVGTTPGLMVYKNLTIFPSEFEKATVKWMYSDN